MISLFKYFILTLFFFILQACANPFAPSIADKVNKKFGSEDQSTIEGLFNNFKSAYIFKDTLMYGQLLSEEFTFIYKDPENSQLNKSWGRTDDMRSTNGLFKAAENLSLIWDDTIISGGDSLKQEIYRSFTLSIQFSPTDKVMVYGTVNFSLKRDQKNTDWKIIRWQDESYF